MLDDKGDVRLELSAPLVNCSALTPDPGEHIDSKEKRVRSSLLPFGYFLKACRGDFPKIVVPEDKRLTKEQAADNLAEVAQCVVQNFYAPLNIKSHPYFSLDIFKGIDPCRVALGSSWRMPTEADARYLTREDREAFQRFMPGMAMGGYETLLTYARARDGDLLLVGFGMREVGVQSFAELQPDVKIRIRPSLRCARTSSTEGQRSTPDNNPAATACGAEMVRNAPAPNELPWPPKDEPHLEWVARFKVFSSAIAATPSTFDPAQVETECDAALPLARPLYALAHEAEAARMRASQFTIAAEVRESYHLRHAAQRLALLAFARYRASCSPTGVARRKPSETNPECDGLLRLLCKLNELQGFTSPQGGIKCR